MAFAAPRIGVAAVVDRSPAAILPDEVPLLPFCIMLLSLTLVLISHFRRKLESGLIEEKYSQRANCASDCETAGLRHGKDKQPCLRNDAVDAVAAQCQNLQGAPGLSISELLTPPAVSLRAAPMSQVAERAEQRQGPVADDAQISPCELEQMEPPTRRQKLVVSSSTCVFRIHVNEAHRRYQVYCGQKELKSISWGCQNGARPWDSWKKVQKLVLNSGR
eukprot:TRINITY_DN18522_c0_g1_i1.p1 TRINITY_DN18522_c0_g1~~TRINITY_DN18522_c0_g1_i1.p1  ORF type:complete len:247 (+),score=41.15 TRINITY_DN18522_c0_g1_i1:85-741(+)